MRTPCDDLRRQHRSALCSLPTGYLEQARCLVRSITGSCCQPGPVDLCRDLQLSTEQLESIQTFCPWFTANPAG